jgi:hypothetical protein
MDPERGHTPARARELGSRREVPPSALTPHGKDPGRGDRHSDYWGNSGAGPSSEMSGTIGHDLHHPQPCHPRVSPLVKQKSEQKSFVLARPYAVRDTRRPANECRPCREPPDPLRDLGSLRQIVPAAARSTCLDFILKAIILPPALASIFQQAENSECESGSGPDAYRSLAQRGRQRQDTDVRVREEGLIIRHDREVRGRVRMVCSAQLGLTGCQATVGSLPSVQLI